MTEDDQTIELFAAIIDAIDEYAEEQSLSVGTVLSALFSVMITTAMSSPNYNREEFLAALAQNVTGALDVRH